MSQPDPHQVFLWLRDGIAAAKANRRQQARDLLMRVVEADDRNEQAWLWLSGVVDADADRLICLENVLTLNPGNVQARAGLKWLQERGVNAEQPAPQPRTVDVQQPAPQPRTAQPAATVDFLTPDGCVYCSRPVRDVDSRCPHCGGRLVTRHFKREERSFLGYLLHAYWVLLICINAADFLIIGYVWNNKDQISNGLRRALPYFAGPVVAGASTLETFVETDLLVDIVRVTLLGLSVLAGLDALGLFLRRPRAHPLGLALVTLHLVFGLGLFAIGFLGYIMAAFRALMTALLTIFLFNTVEDYSQEERRERLEPDRHLVNDLDYYARGRAYEKRGMWAKALLHWRRAIALNPRRDSNFAAAARAYAFLGRYDDALTQLDEAIRVSRRPQEWEPLREALLQEQGRATSAHPTSVD